MVNYCEVNNAKIDPSQRNLLTTYNVLILRHRNTIIQTISPMILALNFSLLDCPQAKDEIRSQSVISDD